MTVILGLKSAEGLVLASDSQATSMLPGGTPVKLDATKVSLFGQHVLWAGTGSQGCGQRVELALAANAEILAPTETKAVIGTRIHAIANQIQQASRGAFIQYTPQAQIESWGGIFCGWAADGPFIAEVDLSGGWQFHDMSAATGSGHSFAYLALASVQHHNTHTRSLEHAKVLAYRAIELTCTASAFGVGMPVQMGVVTADGATLLSGDEIDALGETVDLWKSAQVDALGEALGDTGGAPAAEPGDLGLEAPDPTAEPEPEAAVDPRDDQSSGPRD